MKLRRLPKFWSHGFACLAGLLFTIGYSATSFSSEAFKINGKVTTIKDLMKLEQDKFYRLEKDKYQLVEGLARQAYLDAYFKKMGDEQKISAEAARERYMDKHAKFTDKEIKETLEKYKNHPKLKELPKAEQENQIRNLLRVRGEQEIVQAIISDGLKAGHLQISYPRPSEPVYDIKVTSDDHVRYHADDSKATKPVACKGDDCAITIVEYSEYQCPFCARVIPTTKQILKEYEGKVRWITRDFPLDFHDRARPAAIAAHCAGFQGKFWDMYSILFENQRSLSDKDLDGYADKIKLDKDKYLKCVAEPQKAIALIDKNMQTGASVGVTGTPAFFINGRRLSGALPFEEFKRVIDDELAKAGKKS
ncbi:MAG: thioredoxin domain-containing protein [Oligoflexales bacterium]|nr:thioredoxin domain-containing protein [Oligoflexales bacterium]